MPRRAPPDPTDARKTKDAVSWKRLVIRFGVVALALTTILGLAPIFPDTGRGSDVMQPMDIPASAA